MNLDASEPQDLPIAPGELPRLAFISSVIDAELEGVRKRVVAAMREAPFLLPWAFEMTPASSGEVVGDYLQKVREATFVFWFVGSRTTPPVKAEINEAIAARKRLLVFLLPAESRDEETTQLLSKVRPHCRYRELADLDQMENEVEAAVSDELARALDGEPSISRLERIDSLGRESRARCIQKWQAAGLELGLARSLANDIELGAVAPGLLPSREMPLVVLIGEAGRGKSLACERFLQAAIAKAQNDATAPVPIFLTAPTALDDLNGALAAAANGLADPRLHGARVVIDGADETGDRSERLLAQARELVLTWPETQVILSSRPMPQFERAKEISRMPKLGDEEARSVVAIAAGRGISLGEYAGWPDPLKDAAATPLFALLIGERLRRGGALEGSRAELLAELSDLSIGSQSEEIRPLLRLLAVLVTARGGGRVSVSELGGPNVVKALETSRLVVVREGEASFPLALTSQWLAAESLAEGTPTGAELAASPPDLELWRFPLAMLTGSFTHSQASAVLGPLAREHPGLVSQIVDESLAHWSKGKSTTPPVSEAGLRIRSAMAEWMAGLGPLADLVISDSESGTRPLPPLGVGLDGDHLAAGWYAGDEDLEDVTRLPLELFFQGSGNPADRGWPKIRSVASSPQAAWAWRWAEEEVSIALEAALNDRALPTAGTALEPPRVWLASLAVLGLAGSFSQPLPVDRVRDRAVELLPQADPNLRGFGPHAINLNRLIKILDRYSDEGIILVEPSRLEIEPSGRLYLSGSATQEVQEGRIASIYQAALDAYEELAHSLFAGLSPFMPIAATLPARLDGHLYSRSPGPGPPEGFEWSLFALPHGQSSLVEISSTTEGGPEVVDRWREEWVAGADKAGEDLRQLRPQQSRWIGMTLQSAIFKPLGHLAAEEIVYDWLWSDLTHIKLASGRLQENHFKTLP